MVSRWYVTLWPSRWISNCIIQDNGSNQVIFNDGIGNYIQSEPDWEDDITARIQVELWCALAHWLQFKNFLAIQSIDRNSHDAITRFKVTLGNTAWLWANDRDFHDIDTLKKQFFDHLSSVHSTSIWQIPL